MIRLTSFIQSSITSLREWSAINGYPKKKKQAKHQFQEKKLSEKSVGGT